MSVRLLEELSDYEKLALIPMSYSRLNTYEMCNAMYYYSYIQKEEQVFGAAATLGNVIHSVLEERLEAGEAVTGDSLEGLLVEYAEQLQSYDPDGQINDTLVDAGTVMLTEFVDRHAGEIFDIHEKEKAFEIVIGTSLLRGFIDRVDMTGDRLYIVDYKSGKNEVAQKWIHQNLQLGIYALAMDKMFPGKEIYAELYYLRSGKQKGHLFTRDDLNEVEARLTNLLNEVINQQNFLPTTNARICSFCDFAATGACTIGANRKYR